MTAKVNAKLFIWVEITYPLKRCISAPIPVMTIRAYGNAYEENNLTKSISEPSSKEVRLRV